MKYDPKKAPEILELMTKIQTLLELELHTQKLKLKYQRQLRRLGYDTSAE